MNNKELYAHYLKLASIPILGSLLLYLLVSQKTQKRSAPIVNVALEAKVLEAKPVVKPAVTSVASRLNGQITNGVILKGSIHLIERLFFLNWFPRLVPMRKLRWMPILRLRLLQF